MTGARKRRTAVNGDGLPRELAHAADREVYCYQQLVVLARMKHCFLRAGRWPEAVRLADLESQILAHLEVFELTRRGLVAEHLGNPALARALHAMDQARAALIRRLRPLTRANRAMQRRRPSTPRRHAAHDLPTQDGAGASRLRSAPPEAI